MTNTLLSHDSGLSFMAKLDAAKELAMDKATRDARSIHTKLSYSKPSVIGGQGSDHDTSAAMCGVTVKSEDEHGQRTELSVPEIAKKASPANGVLATGNPIVSNPYAGLTARKRKPAEGEGHCKKQSTETSDDSWRKDHSSGDDQFSGRRRFAPAKKPVEKPHIKYATITKIDTRTALQTSDWYERIDSKAKFKRSDLEVLRKLMDLIHEAIDTVKSGNYAEASFERIRHRLHQAEFYGFLTGILIKKSKLLEESGLPAVFEGEQSVFPWDVRADALFLYQRWLNGQLDPDLLVGIETKAKTLATGKVIKTRNLDRSYAGIRDANYSGENDLHNGQWWPLQICALRDGAHGEIEAGIHGQVGNGAYSVVLSNGGYADVDNGITIKYCGTAGAEGKPTAGTMLLKESIKLHNPVRVLRSAALPATNNYRPTKGLRYDGLYDVQGFTILDVKTEMHQFMLTRQPGQDPIRYEGVEARPTAEQLHEYVKLRQLLGLAA